jgi:hypothetical protein
MFVSYPSLQRAALAAAASTRAHQERAAQAIVRGNQSISHVMGSAELAMSCRAEARCGGQEMKSDAWQAAAGFCSPAWNQMQLPGTFLSVLRFSAVRYERFDNQWKEMSCKPLTPTAAAGLPICSHLGMSLCNNLWIWDPRFWVCDMQLRWVIWDV